MARLLGAKGAAALMVAGLACLLLAPSASAASAGLKPSQAPLISVGQHYFGNTAHADNANDEGIDLWRLPPLLTSDVLTIAWNATGNEWPSLCLAQDVDDYSWAENLCNGSEPSRVSSSGSARTVIQVRSTTSAAFLEFSGSGCCWETSQAYDFVIESIQRAIGISLNQTFHIRRNGVITAHANLADGSPVPDGLTFYLNVRAPGQYHAQYQATSSGGTLSFPLALPASATGQTAAFSVTRPADAQYLRASSSSLRTKVAQAKSQARRRRHHRRHHHRASRVAADNVPARFGSPETGASGVRCQPDSQNSQPEWRATYGFRTPNGKESVHTVKPQGLVRFVTRVAGNDINVFTLEVPLHYLHSDLQVLKRGSHPAWYRGGGSPNWPIKGLCNWQGRNISFLVQLGNRTRPGQRVCLPYDGWGKNGINTYPETPLVQYKCLRVTK